MIVHDGGTNYASGINATEAIAPIFEKALQPLFELDPEKKFVIRKVPGLPRGIGSDHDSYLAAGVPGFFWLQAGRAKYGFTHHTQHDTFDKAIPEYQRHTAMVVAIAALQIADLPELLPRTGLTGAQPKRRLIGVNLDPDMVVGDVTKDGPAEKAGVKPGDRLLRFNGQQIGDSIMLGQAIQSAPKEAKIVLVRDGKEIELTVALPD